MLLVIFVVICRSIAWSLSSLDVYLYNNRCGQWYRTLSWFGNISYRSVLDHTTGIYGAKWHKVYQGKSWMGNITDLTLELHSSSPSAWATLSVHQSMRQINPPHIVENEKSQTQPPPPPSLMATMREVYPISRTFLEEKTRNCQRNIALATSSWTLLHWSPYPFTYRDHLCYDSGCLPADLPNAMQDRNGWR